MGGSRCAAPQWLLQAGAVLFEGGQLPYLPTCPLNSKGADAAEPDEPEFWSRASRLRNERR